MIAAVPALGVKISGAYNHNAESDLFTLRALLMRLSDEITRIEGEGF